MSRVSAPWSARAKPQAWRSNVRMGEQRQGSGLAVCSQKQIDGRTVQRLALFAEKERLHARANLHPGAVFQPGAASPTHSTATISFAVSNATLNGSGGI